MLMTRKTTMKLPAVLSASLLLLLQTVGPGAATEVKQSATSEKAAKARSA